MGHDLVLPCSMLTVNEQIQWSRPKKAIVTRTVTVTPAGKRFWPRI